LSEIFIRFLSWGNSFGSLEAGGEKNESDGPEALDSSSPRVGCFCRRKFVVSLAQKGAKKRVCGCFLFCIERERAAQE